MIHGLDLPPIFVKFYWNRTMLFHFCIIYGCFLFNGVWNSCDRNHSDLYHLKYSLWPFAGKVFQQSLDKRGHAIVQITPKSQWINTFISHSHKASCGSGQPHYVLCEVAKSRLFQSYYSTMTMRASWTTTVEEESPVFSPLPSHATPSTVHKPKLITWVHWVSCKGTKK